MPETEGMSWCRHFDRAIDCRLVKEDRPPCIAKHNGCGNCPESTYRVRRGRTANPLCPASTVPFSADRPPGHMPGRAGMRSAVIRTIR